jgi:hypothetical protein
VAQAGERSQSQTRGLFRLDDFTKKKLVAEEGLEPPTRGL